MGPQLKAKQAPERHCSLASSLSARVKLFLRDTPVNPCKSGPAITEVRHKVFPGKKGVRPHLDIEPVSQRRVAPERHALAHRGNKRLSAAVARLGRSAGMR